MSNLGTSGTQTLDLGTPTTVRKDATEPREMAKNGGIVSWEKSVYGISPGLGLRNKNPRAPTVCAKISFFLGYSLHLVLHVTGGGVSACKIKRQMPPGASGVNCV